MKKMLLILLCLSFVILMSCGGNNGGTSATADTSVAGATVSSCLSNYNPASDIATTEVNVNEVAVDTKIDCPVSGTIDVLGTIDITANDNAFSISGNITQEMKDCVVTDTACDFGDVEGNGTLTTVITGNSDGSAVTFTEAVTGNLTFVFQGKTLPCAVDLSLNVNADTNYTQDGLVDGMTGTICGADWTSVKEALNSTTKMTELCEAFDAAAN